MTLALKFKLKELSHPEVHEANLAVLPSQVSALTGAALDPGPKPEAVWRYWSF